MKPVCEGSRTLFHSTLQHTNTHTHRRLLPHRLKTDSLPGDPAKRRSPVVGLFFLYMKILGSAAPTPRLK